MQTMKAHKILTHFSTVLEFELRRAKETIKELRENLTEYAQGNVLKYYPQSGHLTQKQYTVGTFNDHIDFSTSR